MQRVYSQKEVTVTVNGVTLQDFADGTAVTMTLDGGEVDKTQGMDGPGINLATEQGATLKVSLRETSRSLKFMRDLYVTQKQSNEGCTVVVRTGAKVLYSMPEAFVSQQGELATGDKTQGAQEYTFMSAELEIDNLELNSLFATTPASATVI